MKTPRTERALNSVILSLVALSALILAGGVLSGGSVGAGGGLISVYLALRCAVGLARRRAEALRWTRIWLGVSFVACAAGIGSLLLPPRELTVAFSWRPMEQLSIEKGALLIAATFAITLWQWRILGRSDVEALFARRATAG